MMKIKTKQEIELIKECGYINSKILKALSEEVKPGKSLLYLDDLCKKKLKENDAESGCLNYKGFPKHLCISVNDVIVHGVPNDYVLKDGDLVKLDLVVKKNGYMADSAITVGCGNISKEAQNILDVTKKALYSAIYTVKNNSSTLDLANAVKNVVKPYNYGILVEYCGHGIGKNMHEEPFYSHDPNFTEKCTLKSGMVICIEPMITEGSPDVTVLKDGWSVKTLDGKLSAHFEHTVLVTDSGYEILTE
jgi:methionyl aminopeptidase